MRRLLHGVLALVTVVGVLTLMSYDPSAGSTIQDQFQNNDTGPPSGDPVEVFVISVNAQSGEVLVSRELTCDRLADPAWEHLVIAVHHSLTDLGPIAIAMDYKDDGAIDNEKSDVDVVNALFDNGAAPVCLPDFRPEATTILAGFQWRLEKGRVLRTPTPITPPVLSFGRTAISPQPTWLTVNAGSRTMALG